MYQMVLLAAMSGAAAAPAQYGYYGMSSCGHAIAVANNGKVTILFIFAHQVVETQTRTVKVKDKDGRDVEKQEAYAVFRTVLNESVQVVDADQVKGIDVNGKPVSLSSRLAQPARVLTSHDPQAIDSALRSVLRNDVVMLILPMPRPEQTAPGARPVGAPKAKSEPPPKPQAPKHSFKPPSGPAPSVATATLDDRGNVTLHQSGGHSFFVDGFYEIEKGKGVVEKAVVKIKTNNFNSLQQTMDARAIKGLEASGKQVPAAALNQRLRASPKVLLVPGGNIDPYYMEVFRSDVLIIVPPSAGHGHAPVGAST